MPPLGLREGPLQQRRAVEGSVIPVGVGYPSQGPLCLLEPESLAASCG